MRTDEATDLRKSWPGAGDSQRLEERSKLFRIPYSAFRILDSPWISSAIIFVVTRVVAVLGAHAGVTNIIAADPSRNKGWLAELSLMWDAAWYAGISLNGYRYEPGGGGDTNVAFAPLYPFLVRVLAAFLHWITFGWDFGNAHFGSIVTAGLIISNVSFYFALVLLIRLLVPRLGLLGANIVALALASLPTAFFFSGLYTEGLFLLLVVGAFSLARSDWRGKWLCAGLIGMLASLDRFAGLLLFPVLVVEYLSQSGWRFRKIKADILWTALVPAGFGIYITFLWLRFGNPFVLTETMQTGWNHKGSFFVVTYWESLSELWQSLTGAFPPGKDPVLYYGQGNRLYLFLDLALPLLLLLGGIVARKRLQASEWVWLVFGIIYPLSTNITFSLARYVLPLWPGLIWLGQPGKWRRTIAVVWIIISLGLMAWGSSIYGDGRWIG
jgi:mannosyltransferase PIG-V